MWQTVGGTLQSANRTRATCTTLAPYQFAAIQQNYWPVCNGSGQTIGQAIAWVLIGYPPAWHQSGAYTAPTPL